MRDSQIAALRPEDLLPRRAELLLIDQALNDAANGNRAMLAFVGPPGAGKTFLGSSAAARANELGLRVATASGHALGNVPLLVAHVIARQLEIELPPETDAATVLSELHRGVDALARGPEPLLLIFDDADGYDPSDLALLEQLLLRPPPGRLAVIVTARVALAGRSADTLLPMLNRLDESGMLQLHTLEPLAQPEVRSLLRSWFGGAVVSARFAEDLLTLSGGNAGYLAAFGEALRAMPARDRTEWLIGNRAIEEFPLPEALDWTVSRQLAARDSRSRALLQAVAVWSGAVGVERIARLADVHEDEAVSRLAKLEAARVLRCRELDHAPQFEFADEVVRHVVYTGTPSIERQRLHNATARMLEADGAQPGPAADAELAEHYMRGSLPLDPPRTERVIEGARFYARTGHYAEVARLLEGALRRLEGTGRFVPPDGLALLGEAYVRQGAVDQAEEILRRAEEQMGSGSHAGYGPLIHRLIRIRINRGDDDAALELSEPAVRALDSLAPSDQIDLLGDLASLKHVAGHPTESRQFAERALTLAESTGDPERASTEARKLANFALTAGDNLLAIEHGRRAYSLARIAHSDRAAGRAALGIGMARMQGGLISSALRWIQRSRRGAVSSGDRPTEAYASFVLARTLLEAGQWDRAAEFAGEAVELDTALHRDRALRASVALSDRIEIGRDIAAPAPVPTPLLQGRVPSLNSEVDEVISLVDQQLERESWDTAAQMLQEFDHALAASPGWEYPLYVDVLPRAALVFTRLGDRPRLVEVVDRLEASPLREDAPLAGIERRVARARLARLDGGASEAAHELESAAEAFGQLEFAYRQAMTLAEAGAAWAEASEADRGAALLKEAFRLLDRSGAAREVARVRTALHALHRRAPAPVRERADGTLTPRERGVATLASGGKSNAEIATELGISERTVTTHMHNLLRKLSLRSRHELRHETSRITASA